MNLINKTTAPVVALLKDPTVDLLINKNSIPSLSVFLAPFVDRLSPFTVSVNGNNILLDNFQLRFVDLIEQVDPVLFHSSLITHVLPKYASANGTPGSASANGTPWFDDYCNLLTNIGILEHETFNHPVACLSA
jgi:hypothetical protein